MLAAFNVVTSFVSLLRPFCVSSVPSLLAGVPLRNEKIRTSRLLEFPSRLGPYSVCIIRSDYKCRSPEPSVWAAIRWKGRPFLSVVMD